MVSVVVHKERLLLLDNDTDYEQILECLLILVSIYSICVFNVCSLESNGYKNISHLLMVELG